MHVPEEMKAKAREEDQWRDLVDIALATVEPVEKYTSAEQINAVMNRVVRPLLADIHRLKTQEEIERERCMNPYCENPGTVTLQVFASNVGVACDVCAHFPHAYWIKRNGEPSARIRQDLENRSRNRPNHLLEERLDRAIHFACHESDWNWKAEEGVPSPYDAMLPIVLAVFEAIDQPVTDVVNQHEDMRERVAHLLWMIQPTQMPLEWMEAGHPTPQEICDYVTSALQAEAGGGPAGSSDAARWPEPKPGNDLERTDAELPDFDAATAYQEAAMAEQRARIAAEDRLAMFHNDDEAIGRLYELLDEYTTLPETDDLYPLAQKLVGQGGVYVLIQKDAAR